MGELLSGWMKIPLLLASALLAWSAPAVWLWMRCVTLRVRNEPEPSPMAKLIGTPQLDPTKGIVADAVYQGKIIKVLVQPIWWPYLTPSTISPEEGREAAVAASSFSAVKPEGAPSSLVKLTTKDGAEIGMGSRVKYRGGDYLLTAYHCWEHMGESFGLSRNGVLVQVDNPTLEWGSPNLELDFALIAIAPQYWAKLGVKASTMKALPSQRTYASVYGGPTSRALMSTSGAVWRSETVPCLEHSCSTAAGWSGSPLYVGDCVVGVHTRQIQYGVKNAATDVAAFLDALTLETVYSESGLRLIDMDEVESRLHAFQDFQVEGKKGVMKGKMAKGELALYKPLKTEWYDALSDDELPDVKTDPFYRRALGLETALPLNCQQAAVASVPPLPNLAALIGKPASPSAPVCDSGRLEDRLVRLERDLSALLARVSLTPCQPSPNSQVLVGQLEVPLRREDHCSSKLESSGLQLRPQTLKKPLSGLSPSIPKVEPSSASESPSSSTKNSSGSKSKRRRTRKR